jgi:hypothetical protein
MIPAEVSAVLVTRGDVDLREIIQSLRAAGIADVVIWNNMLERDLAVYGRYHAIEQTLNRVIYVQDDDCVLAPDALTELLAAYEPGVVTCNVPERFRTVYPADGTRGALVGFGAVFDRELPEAAFDAFSQAEFPGMRADDWPARLFYRRCDNVFTTLTPVRMLDLPYRDLPWASGPGRMWTTPGHAEERDRMITLAQQVRGQAAAR